VLKSLGGFDEALGAGTPTAGGEDLDIFVRILQAGHSIAYEPGSLVWHHHRADLPALRTQMYAYGTGLSSFLTKHIADAKTRRDVLRRVPPGLARLAAVPAATRTSLGPSPMASRVLLLWEFAGMLAGPVLYFRARRRGGAPVPGSAVGAPADGTEP
jgi:hypothetical protein